MNNELMAKGMMIAFRGLGIEIENWVDTPEGVPVIYISVPKESTDVGPTGIALAGKKLADRVFTKLNEMGAVCQVKFKIRDEVWTKEKRLLAEEIAKYGM